MDWLDVLDIDQALANVETDSYGDWYRDPWSWREARWVARHRPQVLVERLNSSGVRRAVKLDVAKENFGIRPAIVMDPVDRLAYQALVDHLSVNASRGLRPWVYGWRLNRQAPTRGRYVNNGQEWQNFLSSLIGLADWHFCVLKTDIVSFFASVNLDYLGEQLARRCGSTRVVERTMDMLLGWSAIAGRSGLPQRSAASALLANIYLSVVDDVLDYYGNAQGARGPLRWGSGKHVASVVRWMDDIWLFGRDPATLRHAQLDIQAAMRDLGLHVNLAKTNVLEGVDVDLQTKQIEHSAVDDALDNLDGPERFLPLEELTERILDSPEHASRTSIRFIAHRSRANAMYSKVPQLVEAAERMPHGADHLARLFRDSEQWRELDEWYVDYATSAWGVVNWSIAQLGTMFPTDMAEDLVAVKDYWAARMMESPPLELAAVTSQRLAHWDNNLARVTIREAARRSESPLHRRTLALAALGAGEEPQFVRGLLGEFEENQVTLSMLEERSFRPLKVAPDFQGD